MDRRLILWASIGTIVLALIVLVWMSAGFGSSAEVTDVNLSTGINQETNQPVNPVADAVPNSVDRIYLSGQVLNPQRSTVVRVSWQRNGEEMTTTELTGNRNSSRPFDFDRRAEQDNYFYVWLERPGLTWSSGNYSATVFLNGSPVAEKTFEVVQSTEFERRQVSELFEELVIGDQANETNRTVTSSTEEFARTTERIFIGVALDQPQSGIKVDLSIRYLEGGMDIATLTKVVDDGREDLLFDMTLDRFGSLWADGLWGPGLYEVTVELNSVTVETETFRVA